MSSRSSHDLWAEFNARRVVTETPVGELGRFWTKMGARFALAESGGNYPGPVEWRIERRGLRWAIVGYQAILRPDGRLG